MVKKAVALQPRSGAIIDSLGWGYYRMGDYRLAALFRSLTRLDDQQQQACLVDELDALGRETDLFGGLA